MKYPPAVRAAPLYGPKLPKKLLQETSRNVALIAMQDSVLISWVIENV